VNQRLLSIGEFAAATQLSPKALRLYDDQRLLRPATINAANGYRYYRSDQVPTGRMIRTLREMGLSLTEIGSVLAQEEVKAEALLCQLARELDRQYARQKHAFQEALVMLRKPTQPDSPTIFERMRPPAMVAVRAFMADRQEFIERFRTELHATEELVRSAGMTRAGVACCSLIDPLSDEEGRLEVMIPVAVPERLTAGISVRQLAAARCAAMVVEARHTHASELTAALDALFDWFDRRAHRAIDAPQVSFSATNSGLRTEILWAYEPASTLEK
jgi:DNA-binding transcriptional MerR regulator